MVAASGARLRKAIYSPGFRIWRSAVFGEFRRVAESDIHPYAGLVPDDSSEWLRRVANGFGYRYRGLFPEDSIGVLRCFSGGFGVSLG